MNTPRKTVLITALCALGLAHLPAWADKDDEVREAAQEATTVIANRPGMEHKVKREVRVGLGYLDDDSFRLGRFTNLIRSTLPAPCATGSDNHRARHHAKPTTTPREWTATQAARPSRPGGGEHVIHDR